jgi:hypothetical protein
LINVLWLGVIEIKAPVISVQQIRWPDVVEQQYLGRHGRQRREAAHAKPSINFAPVVREGAADRADPVLLQCVGERIQRAGLGNGIGIQKEQDIAGCQASAPIRSRCKASIFDIFDYARGRIGLLGLVYGVVTRSIVDYDPLPSVLVAKRF